MPDTPNQRPDFRACLQVWSRELRLDELTRALGREPTQEDSTDIADPSWHAGGPPRTYAAWRLELVFDRALHRGCNGLGLALRDLGHDLADRARELAERGCAVSVLVEQHVDPDDPQTDGIHLDEFAIAWLARAGASLDVDQYAKEATFRAAVRGWAERGIWALREHHRAAQRGVGTIPLVRRLAPGFLGARPRATPPLPQVESLRPDARRLLEELTSAARLPEPQEDSEHEDWTIWAVALRQHLDMLSEVASGRRPARQDLRNARELRMSATRSIRRWPDRWSVLAEADALLDLAL